LVNLIAKSLSMVDKLHDRRFHLPPCTLFFGPPRAVLAEPRTVSSDLLDFRWFLLKTIISFQSLPIYMTQHSTDAPTSSFDFSFLSIALISYEVNIYSTSICCTLRGWGTSKLIRTTLHHFPPTAVSCRWRR
jgi:hypothetical protein